MKIFCQRPLTFAHDSDDGLRGTPGYTPTASITCDRGFWTVPDWVQFSATWLAGLADGICFDAGEGVDDRNFRTAA